MKRKKESFLWLKMVEVVSLFYILAFFPLYMYADFPIILNKDILDLQVKLMYSI